MKQTNEITALVSLLDDPDEFIYSEVRNKLISYGTEVIPCLEGFWEDNPLDLESQIRIENLIQEIQFSVIHKELGNWKNSENPSLLEGTLIINKYQYPDLDEIEIRTKINEIKQDIWLEISNDLTSFEKINVINKILFEQHAFSGNKKNYHSPKNSYLNNVLNTKKGNPLSLSVVYILVTEELGMPIFGVNLPNHFVVCYLDQESINYYLDENKEEKVLIYMNPFSKGSMFNHEELDRFLHQLKKTPKEAYYAPCSNVSIVKRMLHNLVFSYEKLGYTHKMDELEILLEIFK